MQRSQTKRLTVRWASWVLVAVLAPLGPALQAQTTTTEILGLVTDATSAVIPGANVTITRVATGESRSAVTGQTGEYHFPLIGVGEYTVRVETEGFRSETVTGLVVEIQQKARVDFTLEVGQVTETVEVVASQVTLQTEDVTVGQVIENKRVVDLPLNGRNITMLAVTVPGVQFGSRTGGADGQGGYPIPGASISLIANGQREIHQSIQLDGVSAEMPLYNHTSWTPSIDAVEEFKVQTGSFSAEYGGGAGAHVQVTIKGGTNKLHGSVFEFLRNDKLDAEHYFLNFSLAPGQDRQDKNRLQRNQFGTVVSGPIVRNKTFWMFNYEGRREVEDQLLDEFYPTDAMRGGDFSALLTPDINPANGKLFRNPIVVYDPLTGDPFNNNILPADRQHAGAKSVISQFMPRAEFRPVDLLDDSARRPVPRPIDSNDFIVRVDHIFSETDKIFVRLLTNRGQRGVNNLNPTIPYIHESRSENLATQWIHTFGQNVINEARFGINTWDDDRVGPRAFTDFDIDSLGVGTYRVAADNNRKFTPLETGLPFLDFASTQHIRDVEGRFDRSNNFQFNDNLSIIHGSHTLKMGASLAHVTLQRAAANNTRGRVRFRTNESGFDVASFLLGFPNRSETGQGMPDVDLSSNRSAIYITDDWKVSPQLTLNMGFRWDYYGVPVDRLGQLRSLDFTILTNTPEGAVPTFIPETIRNDEAKQKLFNQDPGFFEPRLGIAYRPSDKWVIRAGGGWFSSITTLVNISVFNLQPPLSGILRLDSVTDVDRRVPVEFNGETFNIQTRRFRDGTGILTLDDPFFGGRARSSPLFARSLETNRHESDTWQWSFDIQRELAGNISWTVGYVGSKNTHVSDNVDGVNGAPPTFLDSNTQANRPHQLYFDPNVPELGAQALGRVRFYDAYGNGFYHGLLTRLEKKYSSGLAFGVSYSYSKAWGDGEDSGGSASARQNPLDRLGSRARRAFDLTHSMVINYVWEVPFGRNLTGAAGALLKGWQTNGIVTFRSGFPFYPRVGRSDLNTGGDGNPIRPDRIADGRIDNPTRQLWFDPQAFRRVSCRIPDHPELCHFGNSGKNILNSPPQKSVDFSIFKNLDVTERIGVQLRTELFNALNSPWFGTPRNIGFIGNDTIVPNASRMGEVTSLRADMRIIQFGLKVMF